MTTLRCTQKLLRQLRLSPSLDETRPANRLGDWYANALNVGRVRLVLCVSERSLLPVILQAREYRTLRTRLLPEIGWMLERLGVAREVATAELAAMESMAIGRTRSRSVLGSMNEMILEAHYHLTDPKRVPDLRAASLHLCSSIYGQLNYATPTEATVRALVGVGNAPFDT